jgi:minor extracellular protease Epr
MEPGQLVMYWPTDGEAQRALAIIQRYPQVRIVSRVPLNNLGGMMLTLQAASHADAARLREELQLTSPGWNADFHSRYQPFGDARSEPRLYHAKQIDLPDQVAAPGVRIGMIDTAIDEIPALRSASIKRRDFLLPTELPASSSHGTAVATLIVGQAGPRFRGVAPGAALYAASVFRDQDDRPVTTTAQLAKAIDWLIGERVRVINLSLGGSGDRVMAQVVRRALDSGVILIAAGGNGGADGPPAYPAAYAGVIAVSAIDAALQPYEKGTQGNYIALASPGVDLWTPDKEDGRYVSGTSYAAAIVSGVAALMLAQDGSLTANAARDALCRNARDLGPVGGDPVFGCGLVQARPTIHRLLQALQTDRR